MRPFVFWCPGEYSYRCATYLSFLWPPKRKLSLISFMVEKKGSSKGCGVMRVYVNVRRAKTVCCSALNLWMIERSRFSTGCIKDKTQQFYPRAHLYIFPLRFYHVDLCRPSGWCFVPVIHTFWLFRSHAKKGYKPENVIILSAESHRRLLTHETVM